MAELAVPTQGRATPSAVGQLRAIAWLRWRILVNQFRRKGGAGELIGRILLMPMFAVLALAPILLSGWVAWYLATQGQYGRLSWVLWAAVALTQLVNLNLGQPGTTFDPSELIRFPLPLRRYVFVRFCFGLLSPGNIIMTMMSVAVAVGVAIARPGLLLAVVVAMFVFAMTNVLFTRVVFAWVDRWLSTRRAREVLTAGIFLGSLGIQFLNVHFNPAFQHGYSRRAQPSEILAVGHRVHPYVALLPPELSAGSVVSAARGNFVGFLGDTIGCACFGALFLALYTWRMRVEYRGENLSDVANATRAPKVQEAAVRMPVPLAPALADVPARARAGVPASLVPLLQKELLTLRRNVGLFYGLVAPAVMIFLFAGRMSARSSARPHWILLGAVGYALLGVAPMSYNCFGAEGTGAQTYFFIPVPLRQIFLAKNIFGFLIALFEVAIVIGIVSYVAGRPTVADCVFALLWATATLTLSTTLGNLRSVAAPKKIKQGAAMNRAQSPVSAYIAIGILLGCAAIGAGCELLSLYLGKGWVGLVAMLAFAAAGLLVYAKGLDGIEVYALDHRDTLFEELGKKT